MLPLAWWAPDRNEMLPLARWAPDRNEVLPLAWWAPDRIEVLPLAWWAPDRNEELPQAAVVDILPAPLDGSCRTFIDGVGRKEQRAKEAQVLPSDEDPHSDIYTMGNIILKATASAADL